MIIAKCVSENILVEPHITELLCLCCNIEIIVAPMLYIFVKIVIYCQYDLINLLNSNLDILFIHEIPL